MGLTDPGGRAYPSLVWIQGVHLVPPLAELLMGLWGHMGTLKVLGGGHPKWASGEGWEGQRKKAGYSPPRFQDGDGSVVRPSRKGSGAATPR